MAAAGLLNPILAASGMGFLVSLVANPLRLLYLGNHTAGPGSATGPTGSSGSV